MEIAVEAMDDGAKKAHFHMAFNRGIFNSAFIGFDLDLH